MGYAGVLPYAVHRGTVYFLLGREARFAGFADGGKWSDFGGKLEHGEHTKDGAAREAFEESMGFLGSVTAIKRAIRHENSLAVIGEGRCYLMRIDYNPDYPQLFRSVYQYGQWATRDCARREGAWEKTDAQWITFGKLQELAKRPTTDTSITLRPVFAQFLRERLFTAWSCKRGQLVKKS